MNLREFPTSDLRIGLMEQRKSKWKFYRYFINYSADFAIQINYLNFGGVKIEKIVVQWKK